MVNNPVGDRVVRISIALGVVDAIAAVLRMIARRKSKAMFGADDALILASLVPASGMIVISYLSAEAGGMGLLETEDLELGHGPSRISTFLKLLMSSIVTYTLTITLVKLSILALYRRIFHPVALQKSIPIVGATVIVWFIVSLFTNLFQCRPFNAAFDPVLLYTDHCINLKAYYRGITLSNLCIDVVILYMPLHMVWGLKLRLRQKVELSGIFLLGGVACIAGAMRIVTAGRLRQDNLTYSIAEQYIWSQVEPALGILCACLMTLRPLFTPLNIPFPNLKLRFTNLIINKRKKKRRNATLPDEEGTTSSTTDLIHSPIPPHSHHRQPSSPTPSSSSSPWCNNNNDDIINPISSIVLDDGKFPPAKSSNSKSSLRIITSIDLGTIDRGKKDAYVPPLSDLDDENRSAAEAQNGHDISSGGSRRKWAGACIV